VVPLTDDSIRVKLTPRRPRPSLRPGKGKAGEPGEAPPAVKPAPRETLPNPY
jgi:hypothetical protein